MIAGRLDIVFVVYNSQRWIHNCLESLANSDFDLGRVGLYFADNASSDGTAEAIASFQNTLGAQTADFQILKIGKNVGFGQGNNRAAALGEGEYIFFLNIDTTVRSDTLKQILFEVESDDGRTGIWELRQLPFEHPKMYDPLNGETSWSSGACFVIRRSLFEKIEGFDRHIFMYAEDVDLSWRVRAEGYLIQYIPRAVVHHYCYRTTGEVKPTQYVYSTVYNLLLRLKFGSLGVIVKGNILFLTRFLQKTPIPKGRRRLLWAWLKCMPAYGAALRWRIRNRSKRKRKTFLFLGWDYEQTRQGAFYENILPSGQKLVSVLVRTCGRPDVLRETLRSLQRQTYRNFEVVVVEDGPETARTMLREEFSDLRIVYQATGERVGRCRAGNLALQMATGDYFNFLDDDDLFFADHIETLVSELERHPEIRIAYTLAFDTPIQVLSRSPYRYRTLGYRSTVHEAFNRLKLLHHNLFPLQAVMFCREVYESQGGFDESLTVLEDWDLWVRYATRYAFRYVEKTTSIYRTPAEPAADAARQLQLDEALKDVRNKHNGYVPMWTMEQIQQDSLALIEQTQIGTRRLLKQKAKQWLQAKL